MTQVLDRKQQLNEKVLDFQKVYISLLNSEVKSCRLIIVLEALAVQLPHLESPFCLEGKGLNGCAMSYKVYRTSAT